MSLSIRLEKKYYCQKYYYVFCITKNIAIFFTRWRTFVAIYLMTDNKKLTISMDYSALYSYYKISFIAIAIILMYEINKNKVLMKASYKIKVKSLTSRFIT